MADDAVPRLTGRHALPLAFYVACSWTWVIGMFLPVLLVRDFGLLGWAAFAVPNVVGAAAVGWVMRTPRQSAAFVVERATLVGGFTGVTLVLQTFTFAWIVTRLLGGTIGLAAGVVVALLPLVARQVGPSLPRLAPIVWLASATLGSLLWAVDGTSLPPVGDVEPLPLMGLAAVCGLGFLTCPLLDVSLQAARQRSGDRGQFVFGVGFGLLFLAMIALTLGYAKVLPGLMQAQFSFTIDEADSIGAFAREIFKPGNGLALASFAIAGHLFAQVAFTNAAHLAALSNLADATDRPGLRPNWTWVATGVVCAIAGWMFAVDVPIAREDGETSVVSLFDAELLGYGYGELAYRGLLAFYGLVFPIWLLVRGGRWRIGTLVVALPAMAFAFFGGRMEAALVGVALVLLATWATWRSRFPDGATTRSVVGAP